MRVGSTAFGQTEWAYDNLGQLHCTAVRMNVATFGAANPNACVLRTTGAFGPDRVSRVSYTDAGELSVIGAAYNTPASATIAAYTYYPNGVVATVKDGNDNLTTYTYDGFDRRETTFYPSPTTPGMSSTTDYERLGYDAASRVVSLRTRAGDNFTLTYDDLDRLTSKTGPATYASNSVGYSYDNLGRVTASTGNGQPSYAFAYDALGRETSDTSSSNGAFAWQYDLAGRRTRQTWVDGFYVAYDYLVTGEMTAARENGATSGVGLLATYGYDLQGRRTVITRGNGTTTSYGYADASTGLDTPWLTALAHNVAGSAKDVTSAFTYNPAGQIATLQRSNDLYAYTAATNVARGYTVNGLNQATAYTGKTLSYDANGNTTSDGTSAYTYTPENQLKTGPSESGLMYDGTGALYKIGSENVILRSVAGEVATEHDATTGAVENRYVTGAGVDEPLVWYGGSGTTDRHWLLADERGSIVASTDASGAATINAYDEYGTPAATNVGRFGYTGQYRLPSIGLWYYKARMYAAPLGRFMQTDPIGYDGGMNLYAYVGGDPINAADPSGLTQDFGIGCTGTRLCYTQNGSGGDTPPGAGSGTKGSGGGGGQWVPSTDPNAPGMHRWVFPNGTYQNYYIDASSLSVGAGAGRGSGEGGGFAGEQDGRLGGGGDFAGGGASGDWGADSCWGPGCPTDAVTVVARSSGPLVVVSSPLPVSYQVVFGYPTENNSDHHINRHLGGLSKQQKQSVRSLIRADIARNFKGVTRIYIEFVMLNSQQFEFRAFLVKGSILNVGTIFPGGD